VLSINQEQLERIEILRAKIHLLLFNVQNPFHWSSLCEDASSALKDFQKINSMNIKILHHSIDVAAESPRASRGTLSGSNVGYSLIVC